MTFQEPSVLERLGAPATGPRRQHRAALPHHHAEDHFFNTLLVW
jgi:hypothetical protein